MKEILMSKLHRPRDSIAWPEDAANGLSFSRMQQITGARHPTVLVDGNR